MSAGAGVADLVRKRRLSGAPAIDRITVMSVVSNLVLFRDTRLSEGLIDEARLAECGRPRATHLLHRKPALGVLG
jgi:hypothetical protein